MSRRFEAVLEDNAPGVVFELPCDPKQELRRARAPVRVTIGGFIFRTTVAVYGGRALIGVNKANREAAGVAAGDRVTVEVELDAEPREVEVPPELAASLEAEPELRAFFDGLSFTHRREYADWIAEAKREETRRRRAEKALELLRGGVQTPGRPEERGLQSEGRPGDRGPPGPRKVRTPKGRTLGKPQAAKADGQWHRKQTASGGSPETPAVRVKR